MHAVSKHTLQVPAEFASALREEQNLANYKHGLQRKI
jgi:hypothetical protein